MSPHDRVPGELKPEKISKALLRLGFRLESSGGKGSHLKLVWRNEKMIIIQRKLHRGAILGLLKEVKNISGLTWDDIKEKY